VILWIDAQISPRLRPWIGRRFAVETEHVRDLGLREAEDREIFDRAHTVGLVVLTKDEDFVDLVRRLGTPPQVLWLRCGNMSNARLKAILARTLPDALELLRQGEAVVEISRAEGEEEDRTKRATRPRPRGRSGKRAAPRSGRGG
jgi:predicted nuclease of predicted toxin-antitoxin system